MPAEEGVRTVREAVGIFSSPEALQDAIDELLSSGFHRAELSLACERARRGEKASSPIREGGPVFRQFNDSRAAYVSTEAIGDAQGGLIGGLMYVGATVAAGGIVASGGTVAAVIVAAALAGGVGGLIGSILAKWVGDHHSHYLQEQMDRGGLLLWVNTRDVALEERAVEILKKGFLASTCTCTPCL